MIDTVQGADIMTIENDLALQLVPILLDMVVLDHNDHHFHLAEELVEVQYLVLHNLLLGEEGVEGLEGTGEMALLNVEHLESGTLADVVHILLIRQAIEAYTAVVGDAVFLHNLVDALQHKHWLVVVGLHALVNDLGELRIVTHQEPRVNRDAVAAHARAGLQDVYTGVHVADADDFVHVHVVVAADAAQLVGESNVHSTVGVLDHLGHLGSAYVGNHNLALAEAGIILLHLLSNLTAVGTNGAVVVQQLIHHVAGDDALGGMHQIDVLAYPEAVGLDDGTHKLVDGSGRYSRFHNHCCSLGTFITSFTAATT